MANIRVDVPETIHTGYELVFLSPCDCSEISGLSVYYPNENGIKVSKDFVFKDAHGHNLGNVNDLFTKGVFVKVILGITASSGVAYIQNADTNYYLEKKFEGYIEKENLSQNVKNIMFSDILVIG